MHALPKITPHVTFYGVLLIPFGFSKLLHPRTQTGSLFISSSLLTILMILGQVSLLDCLVFLVFLAPQLLFHVNTVELLSCIFYALPFIRK